MYLSILVIFILIDNPIHMVKVSMVVFHVIIEDIKIFESIKLFSLI